MKRPLIIAIIVVLLLASLGTVVIMRQSSQQPIARRQWMRQALAELAARVADPAWPASELAQLQPQAATGAGDDASWLSDRIIVTQKGEWLAYASSCQKQEGGVPDLFLARGSDGRWYYSTFHFCVGMIVVRNEPQPKDLASFATTYFLRTFDGQSDDCLQQSWPLSP